VPLDSSTAARLLDDVFAAANDRCVLLITHRAEGLDQLDEVVVLPSQGEEDDGEG
jgi:ABC-type transport system involved in cytochrome bd biosynthesis fused ATPase/permease subunit